MNKLASYMLICTDWGDESTDETIDEWNTAAICAAENLGLIEGTVYGDDTIRIFGSERMYYFAMTTTPECDDSDNEPWLIDWWENTYCAGVASDELSAWLKSKI